VKLTVPSSSSSSSSSSSRYGFDRERSRLALQEGGGEFGATLERLLGQVFTERFGPEAVSPAGLQGAPMDECLSQREEEALALTAIYGDRFDERITNTVWTVTLDLPFLADAIARNGGGGSGSRGSDANGVVHLRDVCRFYLRGQGCRFGNKCKFVHQMDDSPLNPSTIDGDQGNNRPPPKPRGGGAAPSHRRPCRYFLSGSCAMEDRCRFWHPPPTTSSSTTTMLLPSVHDDQLDLPVRPPPPPHVSRPQEVKLSDLTEEVARELRDTEVKQMIKRFPKHQLMVQEGGDGQATFYRVTVEATDPDWVQQSESMNIDNTQSQINLTAGGATPPVPAHPKLLTCMLFVLDSCTSLISPMGRQRVL